MSERALSAAGPDRTTLYGEATWLAIALRWALLAGAAIWLYPRYELSVVFWVLVGMGVANLLLTGLQAFELHPALWLTSVLDLAAITALVILLGPLTGTAVVAYALIVLVLTLAYGWKGVALSLAFYVAGESAILLASAGASPGIWALSARIGSVLVAALVLGALVERHETLRVRLERVVVDQPRLRVRDLQEFTSALEFLHKLAIRGKWPYSVMVIDIERPGAPASYREDGIDERLLQQLASEARAALRSTDIVGRVGADVFAIAMPDTPQRGAIRVARRIEERLRQRAAELEFFVGLAEIRPSRKNAYDECLHSAFASVRESKGARVP